MTDVERLSSRLIALERVRASLVLVAAKVRINRAIRAVADQLAAIDPGCGCAQPRENRTAV